MGTHPLNLALRFVLELAALAALAWLGWSVAGGAARWILAIGFPILAATLWGTFAVPNDASRSGKAPVPVSGPVRLALEAAFFGVATASFAYCGHDSIAAIFAIIVLAHYALSYDRLQWLLQTRLPR